MDHVAIMNKEWNLIPKILSKGKTIETRWYKNKKDPWNKIQANDVVYFKDSGSFITAKAVVDKVLQYDHYSLSQLKEIIEKYGGSGKINFSSKEAGFDYAKEKNYGILIFLKEPKEVKPFNIDKKGFGNANAWLCVEDIEKIKL